MKILFIIGAPHIGGGTNVILQHAVALAGRGMEVFIASSAGPITAGDFAWHPASLEGVKIAALDDLAEESFDVAFATWWRTVFELHRVKARCYAYFVQSIETRFFPWHDYASQSFAESTYTFALPVITVASWIERYLKSEFDRPSVVARNGVQKSLFRAEGDRVAPRSPGKLRVLIEGPLGVFYKNVEKSIELARRSAAAEVWLMTNTRDTASFPGVDRVFCCVPMAKAPEVYRSCDILLKLSYVEGMFGPPLEMFHCGGTAVVYEVTGSDEYMADGRNSVVAKRDDDERIVAELNRLAADPDYLERLKTGALETARGWPDWEAASRVFIDAVQTIAALPSENRESLAAKSRVFKSWYDHHQDHQNRFYEVLGGRDKFRKEAEALAAENSKLSEQLKERTDTLNLILNSASFRAMQRVREFPLLRQCGKGMRSLLRMAAPRNPS